MGLINLTNAIAPLDDMSVGGYHPLNNTYIPAIETIAGFVLDIKSISTSTYTLSSYAYTINPLGDFNNVNFWCFWL